ncbi:unnamed protein product [Amoebophrya sp. A25]|nr:unnamed protein product [Amoebophrya sp. A25]|eukprot:GSA25T00012257001.1
MSRSSPLECVSSGDCPANLFILFRKMRGGSSIERRLPVWAVLQVRSTRYRGAMRRQFHFKGVLVRDDGGVVLCSPKDDAARLFLPGELSVSRGFGCVALLCMQDPCRPGVSASSRLCELWNALPQRTVLDWCTQTTLLDGFHAQAVQRPLRAQELLLQFSGLPVSYGNTFGSLHNMQLGDYRVLFRACHAMGTKKDKWRVRLDRYCRTAGRRRRSERFDVSHGIDVFMFAVTSTRLDASEKNLCDVSGIFVFPKWLMIRHCLLADKNKGHRGSTWWKIFPPEAAIPRLFVTLAAEQRQFYIPLNTDPLCSTTHDSPCAKKLQQILSTLEEGATETLCKSVRSAPAAATCILAQSGRSLALC